MIVVTRARTRHNERSIPEQEPSQFSEDMHNNSGQEISPVCEETNDDISCYSSHTIESNYPQGCPSIRSFHSQRIPQSPPSLPSVSPQPPGDAKSCGFPPGFQTKKSSPHIPSYFICPITKKIMSDPVIDREGNTFERHAILSWLELEGNSPLTNNPLCTDDLIPNRAVKEGIEKARKEAWETHNGSAKGSKESTSLKAKGKSKSSHQEEKQKVDERHRERRKNKEDQLRHVESILEIKRAEQIQEMKRLLHAMQEQQMLLRQAHENQRCIPQTKQLERSNEQRRIQLHQEQYFMPNSTNLVPNQMTPRSFPPRKGPNISFRHNVRQTYPPYESFSSSGARSCSPPPLRGNKSPPLIDQDKPSLFLTIDTSKDQSKLESQLSQSSIAEKPNRQPLLTAEPRNNMERSSISSEPCGQIRRSPEPPEPQIRRSRSIESYQRSKRPQPLSKRKALLSPPPLVNDSSTDMSAPVASVHNGWCTPLGVHKVTCSPPGLVMTTDVHRRSAPIQHLVREYNGNDGANENSSSSFVSRDLIIPSGSFVEVLETQVHGGRVRGKIVWEEEMFMPAAEGGSKTENKIPNKIAKRLLKLRSKQKKQSFSSHSSSSLAATTNRYIGWISLQWAYDERSENTPKPGSKHLVTCSEESAVKFNTASSSILPHDETEANAMDVGDGPWTEPVPLGVYRINSGSGLPMRETSDRESDVTGILERGRYVEVVETQAKGDRIRARVVITPTAEQLREGNGESYKTGWISILNAVTGSIGAKTVPLGPYVVTSESGCAVTEGSQLDSQVKATIKCGKNVHIVATRIEEGIVRGLISSGGYISLFLPSATACGEDQKLSNAAEHYAIPVHLKAAYSRRKKRRAKKP